MVVSVVGADHEHDHLGVNSIELTISDAPDDVLSLITADAEVGSLIGTVVVVPNVWSPDPFLGDGIAEKEKVDGAGFTAIQKGLVHVEPALVPGSSYGLIRCRDHLREPHGLIIGELPVSVFALPEREEPQAKRNGLIACCCGEAGDTGHRGDISAEWGDDSGFVVVAAVDHRARIERCDQFRLGLHASTGVTVA